jgi:hypothetical protein
MLSPHGKPLGVDGNSHSILPHPSELGRKGRADLRFSGDQGILNRDPPEPHQGISIVVDAFKISKYLGAVF